MNTTSKMKEVGGIWLPAHENHMDHWMEVRMAQHPKEIVDGRFTYQYHKFVESMRHVKRFGIAADVGAHCGTWSMQLAKRFEVLHAFEPVELHRECFALNVANGGGAAVVTLHAAAVGDKPGEVPMFTTPGSSGDSFIDPDNPNDVTKVPMVTIDSLGLPGLDFIKLDTEGYELMALRGAEATLRAYTPCVCVEQKPGKAPKYGLGTTDAVAYLQSLGATLRKEVGGDYIMSWA